MNDPSAALQKGILAHLSADPAVEIRFYDRVPPNVMTPYGSFGPSQALEDGADCVDGFEVFQQIDVWSTEPGFLQVKELAGIVRKSLHYADFTLEGFVLNEIQVRNIRYLRDPDGLTSHAAIDVRALLETDQP